MINYELAKKLKDAGYPQDLKSGLLCAGEDNNIPTHIFTAGGIIELPKDDIVYIPTLSELIEACGDKLRALARWERGNDIGDWQVTSIYNDIFWGKTPEEAVANLWLKLNEKL